MYPALLPPQAQDEVLRESGVHAGDLMASLSNYEGVAE